MRWVGLAVLGCTTPAVPPADAEASAEIAPGADACPSEAGCCAPELPGPGAAWSEPPPPPATWLAQAPKPSLQIELGDSSPTAPPEFVPWADGDKLHLHCGPQGGFHVYWAVRVTLPGETVAQRVLEVVATAWMGDRQVMLAPDPKIAVVQAPGPDGLYQTPPGNDRQLRAICRDCSGIPVFAGRQLRVWVQVRAANGEWGQASRTLVLAGGA
jgi:hypothetical protein